MAQRSKAPNIDNEQGLRGWTHLVGDGIDARTWSNTPSSSSHAEGIVLDCGHRTATRCIEECTIVDNCSFNVIGGVVSTRACQAQPAGLDVAAARHWWLHPWSLWTGSADFGRMLSLWSTRSAGWDPAARARRAGVKCRGSLSPTTVLLM